MLDLTRPLVIAAALALGLPAAAQTTPPAAPADTATQPAAPGGAAQLSMGQQPAGANEPYVAATHGDWQLRCLKVESGEEPCQLYQLLKDAEGNSVAEFSLFALPAGQQAAAGATIITPLETLLTQQITLQVDTAQPKRYPFSWCSPIGCVSRVGFTQAEIDAFKKGTKITLTIVPVGAPDQKVELPISLKGFTAGFDAVKAKAPKQ